ncbi:fatty acid alpha hydroxylase, cytochrome P450 [Niallia circulans]|nr:fatty acid alpha hydroxylase, cytochrome P450 [Niallia circulans]
MASEKEIPKESGIDNSVAVLREGYLYGTNRAQAFQSDLFKTRLLGQEAICIRGEEAAELFYDNEKFKRAGAAPKRVVKTLFGKGGVQALDGEAHHHRKAMFMSLMSKETLKDIRAIASKQWELAAQRWQNQSKVVLYEEAQEVMCRTAFEWAGIPLEEEEVKDKAEWFRAMIEAPAAIGPAHWKGRRNRGKAESWVKELVEDVRTGKRQAAEGKTLHTMSFHRELNGEWMDAQTAAVEIINILGQLWPFPSTFASRHSLSTNTRKNGKSLDQTKKNYSILSKKSGASIHFFLLCLRDQSRILRGMATHLRKAH